MNTVTVIGGGPAGYVAAITAAQQGSNVILIERKNLGGTCLNEGCMPTKALLESAARFEQVKNAYHFGIRVKDDVAEIDWPQVQRYKNSITEKLVQGIHFLMKKNKIQVITGEAEFISSQRIQVKTTAGVEEIQTDKVIIATGSESASLPFAPFDDWVIDSRQAMTLSEIPSSLLIIGGGVIGCEFASIYSRMGSKVTIVEMEDHLLPGEDPDVVSFLERALKKSGVSIYCGSSLSRIDKGDREAMIETKKEGLKELKPDKILVAIGRKPSVAGMNLEKIGVSFDERKGIHVDEYMQTNIPGIYACGDVIGGIQLAHVGFHEGRTAARNACGGREMANLQVVPRCIYTYPEVASVGLNEKQAKERYGDIRTGQFSFAANGKALISGEAAGKVKVIVEPQFNEIVGITIVGPHATELIGQGAIMMQAEMTAESMESFIAAHPTLSEAIHEALLSVSGQQIHA
ncbi:dihydrolipoyl dehydrogenase [Neobacillus mesonae]|uniref:dihydrolipoyl dehydrogenase n=1 Tax=Neobacillus mesonae TaxID=1193713 RepID=UPI0020423500|nr:dihydrolipoyl dehydrogenase [Neobacillus mesonae]MCM3567516.1 dihydrolipoyl dehydrogenase [Neobacillus mesonae]